MEEINVYTVDNAMINALVQWDKGIYIYFYDNEFTEKYNVHFFTSDAKVDYLVEPNLDENNILSVKIPDDLVALGKSICGYICIYDEDKYKNAYYFKIPVRKRPQPANYIYTGSSEYKILNTLINECRDSAYEVLGYRDETKLYYNNAKVSETNAKASEDNAKISETNAKTSETNAKESETNAETSETNALTYSNNAKNSELASSKSETNAKESEANAKTSETNAKVSETNSKESETNAKNSELASLKSETNAKTSETNAKTSEDKAKTSETNAKTSEDNAKSYMNALIEMINNGAEISDITTISIDEMIENLS